jgi:hypothetical protein
MTNKEGGYGIVYREIMRSTKLSPEAKAIYAYLCSFAGSGSTCYPGADLMRSELQMGTDRFYKHMKSLTDAGIVVKSQEREGNRWGKTIYTLNHIPDFQLSQNQSTQIQYTQDSDINNNSLKNNSLKNNSLKNNRTNNDEVNCSHGTQKGKSSGYTSGFEEFWKAYPRKVGKGDAYKKYKTRIHDGYSEEALLEAAVNYAARCASERTEEKFIKHAKTFLSDTLPFTDYIKAEAQSEDFDEEHPFKRFLKEKPESETYPEDSDEGNPYKKYLKGE